MFIVVRQGSENGRNDYVAFGRETDPSVEIRLGRRGDPDGKKKNSKTTKEEKKCTFGLRGEGGNQNQRNLFKRHRKIN